MILADLEDGMWSASDQPGHAKSIQHAYVTAMLKGGSASKIHANGHFAIKGGDSQAGELTVYYEGSRPKGYSPMKKQGSIILGIGGDNSDRGIGAFTVTLHNRIFTLAQVPITSYMCLAKGTFYEGVMARGFTSDATDAAIQKDIVAAGYGR